MPFNLSDSSALDNALQQYLSGNPNSMGNFSLDNSLFGGNGSGGFTLPSAAALNTTDPFSFQGAFGKDGWGFGALSGLSGLLGAYTGLQQLKLGKDNLALQKEAFNLNANNSIQSYNTRLRDVYASRLQGAGDNAASMPSLEEYVRQNSLSRSGNTGG